MTRSSSGKSAGVDLVSLFFEGCKFKFGALKSHFQDVGKKLNFSLFSLSRNRAINVSPAFCFRAGWRESTWQAWHEEGRKKSAIMFLWNRCFFPSFSFSFSFPLPPFFLFHLFVLFLPLSFLFSFRGRRPKSFPLIPLRILAWLPPWPVKPSPPPLPPKQRPKSQPAFVCESGRRRRTRMTHSNFSFSSLRTARRGDLFLPHDPVLSAEYKQLCRAYKESYSVSRKASKVSFPPATVRLYFHVHKQPPPSPRRSRKSSPSLLVFPFFS